MEVMMIIIIALHVSSWKFVYFREKFVFCQSFTGFQNLVCLHFWKIGFFSYTRWKYVVLQKLLSSLKYFGTSKFSYFENQQKAG